MTHRKDERTTIPSYLRGKVVAIFGFENEGFEQARRLRENGVKVIVSLREGSSSERWENDGFQIVTIWEAVDQADIIQVW